MDIVCPLGMSAVNEDLRYSLRSLEENVPHHDVWVIGAVPSWFHGKWIFAPQGPDRWKNTSNYLRLACDDDRISDPFLYTNDDFFALRAYAGTAWNKGPLDAYLDVNRRSVPYRSGALHAYQVLTEMGIENPISFELHIPMVVTKDAMSRAIQMLRDRHLNEAYKRSIAGALMNGETATRTDVKVGPDYVPAAADDWISTTDGVFARGSLGVWLRSRFPIPSRYESKET